MLSYWFDLDEGQNTTSGDDQKGYEISQSQNENGIWETFLILEAATATEKTKISDNIVINTKHGIQSTKYVTKYKLKTEHFVASYYLEVLR